MSTTMLRELSDPPSLDSYTARYLTDTHYLDDVSTPVPQYTSARRGISALGKLRPSIFARDINTECSTPKTKKVVDALTGEITEEDRYYWSTWYRSWMPVRCGRISCRECSIYKARRATGALYLSRPTHVLTVTLVGGDRPAINKRMADFFTGVRKTYPTARYAWTAESNPAGTGAHVHAYVHLADQHLSQTVVDRASSRVGAGSVYVQQVPSTASVLWFGYIFKDLADPDRRDSFAELNGASTLVHSSKSGMWRDGRDGPTIRTRAKAESLALKRSR
jgi:hypothetical protein